MEENGVTRREGAVLSSLKEYMTGFERIFQLDSS
jgi:hypothetical protein